MTRIKPAEFDFAGVRTKLLPAGTHTSNQFALLENTSPGVSQASVHIRASDNKALYIIEGEMEAVIAGRRRVLKAGDALLLPRGVPHQVMNASGRSARYLLLCTPTGFENFVVEAAQMRPAGTQPAPTTAENVARMTDAAPRCGISLLPGWDMTGPSDRAYPHG